MNKTILVPIDYSDVTDAILDQAARLAMALDARLHVVHAAMIHPMVYAPYHAGMGTASPRKSKDQMMREAGEHLTMIAEKCGRDVPHVTTVLLEGHIGPAIMDEAMRIKPMMIVMGSHGHGALHHLLAGSVCEYMMKHAVCPIMIVPSRTGAYDADAKTEHAVTSG